MLYPETSERAAGVVLRGLALPLLLVSLIATGCSAPASREAVAPGGAVSPSAKALYTLKITPPAMPLQVGNEVHVSCEATYAGGSHAVVTQSSTWASSDPSIVTVEAGGILAPVAPGRAVVSARHGDATDQVEVTVVGK